MGYITIKVKRPPDELLFEKDFSPHLLQSLAASDVSNLMSQGILGNKERFSVGIMPRYDNCPEQKEPGIVNVDKKVKNDYNGILLIGEIKENIPITYFTMLIHFRDKMFVREIPVSSLTEVADRLKTTLINIGVIEKEEEIICDYFIRKQNSQKREREIIHAASHKKPSIGLKVRKTKKEDLPTRKISSFEGKWIGSNEDDILILIKDSTSQEIDRHARYYPDKEIGGILIGDVYYDSEIGKIFVEINDIIRADMAVGTGGSISFTIQASEHMNRIKNIEFPDKRKIGWYHSHLIKVKDLSTSEFTSMFFSSMDVAVHKRFREPWQVALVVDSLGKERRFYRWKNFKKNEIQDCKGFYIFSKFNDSEEEK